MCFFRILIFLLIVPFAEAVNAKSTTTLVSQNVVSKKNPKLVKKAKKSKKVKKQKTNRVLTSEDSEDHMWKTQGIILAFNEWPDEQEMVLISEELKTLGLEKTEEIPITKVWFLKYTDNELKHTIEAYAICKKLTERFSLKYCRPEHIPRPRNRVEPGDDLSFINRVRAKPLSAENSCMCKSYNNNKKKS